MLAYLALDWQEETLTTANNPDAAASIVVKIEKMVKQFRSHQCDLGFDIGFIKSTVVESFRVIIINICYHR